MAAPAGAPAVGFWSLLVQVSGAWDWRPAVLLVVGGLAALYLRGRDTDRRVGPSFLSDVLTWLAFFAISGVAIYSTNDLIRQAWRGLQYYSRVYFGLGHP